MILTPRGEQDSAYRSTPRFSGGGAQGGVLARASPAPSKRHGRSSHADRTWVDVVRERAVAPHPHLDPRVGERGADADGHLRVFLPVERLRLSLRAEAA